MIRRLRADEWGNGEVMSLAEAGSLLERSASLLRRDVSLGKLAAVKVGNTWMTIRSEVERYRSVVLERSSCQHNRRLTQECPDCPRAMFTLDLLTDAMRGLDRRTLRDLLGGQGPIGPDLARTLAGDAFDRALGITTDRTEE